MEFSSQEYWSGLPFPSPMHESEKWKWVHSVVSNSYRPCGLQPTRLFYAWDFLGKSTGVGCHCLLQMYSAYKLNKQDDNIQPWYTLFPIWNQSVVPCPVLTVASWPAYRCIRRQVRCSGILIFWRLFQFVVVHTVKRFGIVNKAEIDIFLVTLLLFWWSSGCWQFDLWFLCLF